MLKNTVLMVATFCFIGSSIWAQEEVVDPVELTFGVYSSDKATVMYTMFIPIVRHIQESVEATLKRPVDYQFVRDGMKSVQTFSAAQVAKGSFDRLDRH